MQGLGAPELGLVVTLRSKLAGLILGQSAWHQIFDFLITGAYKQGWRDGYSKGHDNGAASVRA